MKFSPSAALLLLGVATIQFVLVLPTLQFDGDEGVLQGRSERRCVVGVDFHCTIASMLIDSTVGNCTVTDKGTTYNYAQFHVYTPSEHTIDGQAFDGQVHFVHKKEDGPAALVVGLLLQKTDAPGTDPSIDIIVRAMSKVHLNNSIPLTL
ncbi:unnamed protein product [Phytophthora fragariaefolia]|uniref:carbonic anhydrase n=1 Tax=Phytophthora fragariaefolia TaxID=1490495 RepID=A0A9W6XBS8_9STRA|nr:unnamed protein product [Phytophthora fragariaefolia]